MVFGKLKAPDIVAVSGALHDPTRESTFGDTLTTGAIEITEATIALVRSRLIHPTRPELQVLASDQSRRRFEVSLSSC